MLVLESAILAAAVLPTPEGELRAADFIRGDVDASGTLSITDPIVLLNHLFLSGDPPTCLDAADSDDTGILNLTDAVQTLGHLFLGGDPPPAPYPACGADPTDDALDCRGFAPCGTRVIADGGGASVTIPPGAVGEDVEITVKTYPAGKVPGTAIPLNGAAQFGPDGLRFAIPVTVTIPCRVALPAGTRFPLLCYDPAGKFLEETQFLATVGPDGAFFSADVTHFSAYGGSYGEPVFGGFASKFGDCAGPGTSVEDLFWETVAFFIREVWRPGEKVAGSDGMCYRVNGIEFDLEYVPACGGEGGTLYAVAGDAAEGDEEIEYRLVSAASPGQAGSYLFRITVYLACQDPELSLIALKTALKVDEETKVSLMRCDCGLEPMFTEGGETALFGLEGTGEIDPIEVELGSGSPRAETTYRATDFGKAKVSVDIIYSCGSNPEPRAISASVDIDVVAKGEIEYRHDLTVVTEYGDQTEHVRGSVPFSVAGQGVVGGGGVDTEGDGQFEDCSVAISGSATVIITGKPATDGSKRLTLNLDESWTKTMVVTCDDETSTTTLPLPPVTQPVELIYEEGYTLEAPFLGGTGSYRWIVHVTE